MSWFRRKATTGSPPSGRTDIDRTDRSAGENNAGSPVRSRSGLHPEAPRAIDAEFCWGDDRKR
ncbi:MAG TPA: hypothetical protein VM118_02750 [Acidobacteriota bacterium]|nr:hypothetical protein [Acidobacteriota bacterium]